MLDFKQFLEETKRTGCTCWTNYKRVPGTKPCSPGRDAYNAKGANLQAPVTTPPSKLDPDSKAAKRRKSFCARMGGMEGAMEKPNGEPTRKALALRKWNC